MTSMVVAAIVLNIEMYHESVKFPQIRMKLVSRPMFLWSGIMIKASRVVSNNPLPLYEIHDGGGPCFRY